MAGRFSLIRQVLPVTDLFGSRYLLHRHRTASASFRQLRLLWKCRWTSEASVSARDGTGSISIAKVSGTLSYATTVAGVSFGVNCSYHSVSIQNYGSASTVGIDAGTVIPLVQNLTWGLAATNVNAPTIGISRDPLPRRFSTGVSYVLANRFTLAFDLLKESGYDVSPRGGCEYRITDAVALRGGFKNAPAEFSGGIGIRYAALDFDYAYVMNPVLGGTQEISISIR